MHVGCDLAYKKENVYGGKSFYRSKHLMRLVFQVSSSTNCDLLRPLCH